MKPINISTEESQNIFESYKNVKPIAEDHGDMYEDQAEGELGLDPTQLIDRREPEQEGTLKSLLAYPDDEGEALDDLLKSIQDVYNHAHTLGMDEGQSEGFMKALKIHLKHLYPGHDDELIEIIRGRMHEGHMDT